MSKKKKRLKIAIISLGIIIILSFIVVLRFNLSNKEIENNNNDIEEKKDNKIELEEEKEEIENNTIQEDIEDDKEEQQDEEQTQEQKEESTQQTQTTNKNSSSSIKNNTTTNSNSNKENNTSEKVDTNTTTNKDSEKAESNVSNNDDLLWQEFLKSDYAISVLETSTPDFATREEQHQEFLLWFNLGYRVEEPVVCLDLSSGQRCAYSLVVFLPKGVCNETEETKINWRNKNYIGIVAYAKSIGYKCEGYQD